MIMKLKVLKFVKQKRGPKSSNSFVIKIQVKNH
jgi:hypothetical protein